MAQTIKDLQGKLEDMLVNGSRVLFNNKKIAVDADEARAWFTELADFLPVELEEAREIVSKESSILNDAKEEAERMLADARMKAEKAISDADQQATNLRNAAETAARETEQKAQQEYENAIAQANEDARRLIAEAEQEATHLISQQEVLRQARVEAQELTDRTRAELEEKHNASMQYLNGLFEETDRYMSSQLAAMRAKRDELNRSR